MILNQSFQGIAFFEASACLTLLVLFIHLKRDNPGTFYRLWLLGWVYLTGAAFAELAYLYGHSPLLRVVVSGVTVAALVLFLGSIVQLVGAQGRLYWPMVWLSSVLGLTVAYYETAFSAPAGTRWETSLLVSSICLGAGWLLWRHALPGQGHGRKLLAGAFLLMGLNNLDRPLWIQQQLELTRFAFDHFLCATLGVGMIVLLLEAARARSEEISEKMRQFTMLTASSSQSVSLHELLQKVLQQITGGLGASHGIVRLLTGNPQAPEYVVCASVGFQPAYLKQYQRFIPDGKWMQGVLQERYCLSRFEEEKDVKIRRSMADAGITQMVTVALRGKEGPVGLLNIGALPGKRFPEDELAFLVNVANFLGTTVESVNLFEQVKTVQQQWAYTFDSIGDPILVHDEAGLILRGNQRLVNLLGRAGQAVVGRAVRDLFSPRADAFKLCPYCEGISGDADFPDPWLQGYFLASNSAFSDPAGRKLGTIHVLKDITERKRAEEKYRSLVASVQEGVFIATVQGRFLDFNDALMRITGYEDRDALMRIDIGQTLHANPQERARLTKLLHEHGAVNDFEYDILRKDGEIRTVSESSTAVRDAAGNVTAYQGFLLDVSERRRAEQEIRRRNRELVVLNSIAETLAYTLDLNDSVNHTLRQILDLFGFDVASLYLLDRDEVTLRRAAAAGQRSEPGRNLHTVSLSPELIQQLRTTHATLLSTQGLPLPAAIREVQKKEGIESAYVVVLWSNEKIIGGLIVASRTVRELASADKSLLIAVGSQIAGAVERGALYEETRQAYENLRRTQEQLLHSEKLAAVGQLISGVAHELNNPLTAILGYSQLLTSSAEVGPQALGYAEKLYKQTQRTQRIVQNLLSFARQHKPERVPVRLNSVIEDTLALRDYDLRNGRIRVHLNLSPALPQTAADPHQLQQVFLNLINNAVDAILEKSDEGDLYVRTGAEGCQIFVEFTDSGPGVKDASRVFDPFYTTKPVGKGTGLGLSICYGIITEHGGTIVVRNGPSGGATFRVELPLQSKSEARPGTEPAQSKAARSGRVLVVDASESVLDTVAKLLRSGNHLVETATSLAEARKRLAGGEFDLVVADRELVVNLDAEVHGAGKSAASHGLGPNVLWTSSQTPGNGRVCREGTILQKPLRADDLLAAVDARLQSLAAPTLQG